MKYSLDRDNYSRFEVFEQNKLEPRAYFIPFGTLSGAQKSTLTTKRYVSDKVRVLSGEWDFVYYPKHSDMPKQFDTDKVVFDKVKVPSCWQIQGYEPPFYTNINYPYPVVPPKIPTDKMAGEYGEDINNIVYKSGKKQFNSVGIYRVFLEIDDLKKDYIISFLGVAGGFDFYCNGEYVGYSEGSHNTTEFRLNKFLVTGHNELVAVVHKWCNGSYLEDQDMFRHNGIFRDVLLFCNEPTFVWDFQFSALKTGDNYEATVLINTVKPDTSDLVVSICDQDTVIATSTVKAEKNTKVVFGGLKVTEWNAEEPKLYNLVITLQNNGKISETFNKFIGFRTVEIDERVFKFNGKGIKMRGVNHHDTNPYTGYTMTADDMVKDITIFKEYNVNTVRTSHYPPDPMFIELCDFYGIYVVDEGDIECHGTKTMTQISNKLKWKDHYWDRIARMFYRDRNSPSIAMWSLGNESGGIKCHRYCYRKLKELTSIPIHYERACVFKEKGFDVISEMYTSHKNYLNKLGNKGFRRPSHKKAFATKPYFLCEYAHAMGVGAGSLEDYWQIIYSHDNSMGGCIWEFADHAIYHADNKAKYKWTYGGDHGEYTHDGNFCVDGLFSPDRKPHTGALQMKNVYRPVRGRLLDVNGTVEFTNHNDFRNADYLKIKCQYVLGGIPRQDYEFKLDIAPNKSQKVNLNLVHASGDAFINIDYYDKNFLVASEQLTVEEGLPQLNLVSEGAPKVVDDGVQLKITVNEGSLAFDKTLGKLISYVHNNVEYLPTSSESGGVYDNVFRAPLDNDRNIQAKWYKNNYDSLVSQNIKFGYTIRDNSVFIEATNVLVKNNGKGIFKINDSYEVKSDGVVKVKSVLLPIALGLPWLPRVGKVIELNKDFDNFVYYGRGEAECYPDFSEQARIGIFRYNVGEFMDNYIKPQASGNHTDCRYVYAYDSSGRGIMFLATEKPFNFVAKIISDKALAKCAHREDVIQENKIYVEIDSEVLGVGSNSCGPVPLSEYRLRANRPYYTSFDIIPFNSLKVIGMDD